MTDEHQEQNMEPQGDTSLGMSDEDFLSMSPDALDAAFLSAPDGDAEDDDEAEDVSTEATGDGGSDDTDDKEEEDEEDAGGDDSEEDDEDDTDPGTDDDPDSDGDDGDSDDDPDSGDTDDKDPAEESDDAVKYKTFFEEVTSEFKANGKNMKVENPQDIIRLMQMGANYNRKMAGMKPHLKTLKVLEKHDISDEDLGFLVDLKNKNPAAIAKLLQDSEIDPLEFNLDQGTNYKASDTTVDERELALDSVVEEIKDSPTYPQVIKLVTHDWDAASKQAVAEAPQVLKVLNDHMASGIYDLITNEVEQERMFGRLTGMSDIEAYNKVGDAIHARGGFDHLNPSQAQRQQGQQQRQDTGRSTKKSAEERRNKRRAASSGKRAAPESERTDFNPLSLSDEEFLKQSEAIL